MRISHSMRDFFGPAVIEWQARYGRSDLPWQTSTQADPYQVWVSEIMLQQTQVATVVAYFNRFIDRFPTLFDLARADIDEVLALWSGLGYYARARHLYRAACIVAREYAGKLPQTREVLEQLPGIGRSTAGAILSLGMGRYGEILDGNCKRIYCRFFALANTPQSSKAQKQLWQIAQLLTPQSNSARFNQGLMDLGALVCTRTQPLCLQAKEHCPLNRHCQAFLHGQTADYPWKKRKKILPQRQAVFVMLKNDTCQIALYKRPVSGIWGGLWCLPWFDEQSAAIQWIEKTGVNPRQIKSMANFTHKFTHFSLNYVLLMVKLTCSDNCVQEQWQITENIAIEFFSPRQALQMGLPAPIKQLIDTYAY